MRQFDFGANWREFSLRALDAVRVTRARADFVALPPIGGGAESGDASTAPRAAVLRKHSCDTSARAYLDLFAAVAGEGA